VAPWQTPPVSRLGAAAAVLVGATVWPTVAAEASPALVVGEWCTSGRDVSGIDAAVTGLADGTPVTFTVTGGGTTIGPATFQSSQGRTGVTVGFGERVDSARVEAIVRSDGDAVVEQGEQLLTGSVSRPCWSK
jgi:hypothetical protein